MPHKPQKFVPIGNTQLGIKLKYGSKLVLNYPISQCIFCDIVMAWLPLFLSYWHQ